MAPVFRSPEDRLRRAGLLGVGLTHEFANLLATASTSLYLAERSLDASSPAARHVERARTAVDHAAALSERVLGLARGEASRIEASRAHELVASALDGTQGVEVEVEIPQELSLACDEVLTLRIVSNLVDNARRAGAKRVTVTAVREKDHVHLRVVDDGEGIEPTRLSSVFEPLHTTGGTGLGLALARLLAEAQGGSLRAEPHEGGACFVLTLPSA